MNDEPKFGLGILGHKYSFSEGYNYPFGDFELIRKYSKVDLELFNKLNQIIAKYLEKGIKDFLVSKDCDLFSSTVSDYFDKLDLVSGDEAKEYFLLTCLIVAWAQCKYKNESSKWAAIKSLCDLRAHYYSLITDPHQLGHLDIDSLNLDSVIGICTFYLCIDIYLAIRYLEQLGFDNKDSDEEPIKKINARIHELEKTMKGYSLSKEEFEERKKHYEIAL